MLSKVTVKLSRNFPNGYSNSETDKLSGNALIRYLHQLTKEHDKLIIDRIDTKNNTIHITTADSLKVNQVNQKAEEIKEIIVDYLNK